MKFKKRGEKCIFGKLKVGEKFFNGTDIFIKLEPIPDIFNDKITHHAVSLTTGKIYYFSPDDQVTTKIKITL